MTQDWHKMEQIYDHKGNSFFPTKNQYRLYKAGWRLVEKRKMGMILIERWLDPESNGTTDPNGKALHDVWNQGTALDILKQRSKQPRRMDGEPNNDIR